MPTSCHTLYCPQRLSLVWQNTSPSLALQALGNSFAYIVNERISLLSTPVHGSLSHETYLGLVVLLLPHDYKLKADCRIFHIHSQQQWLPYGGGRILRKIRLQDAEYTSDFGPFGPEGGRSTGANGVVLCYIVKFDAMNRKTALLSR